MRFSLFLYWKSARRTNDSLLCILISVASLLDRFSTLSKPEWEWILSELPVLFPDQPRYGSNLSERETSVSSLGFPISWWNPTVERKSSFEKRRLAVCSGQVSKFNAASFFLDDQNEPNLSSLIEETAAPIVCRESRSRWLSRFEYRPSNTFKCFFRLSRSSTLGLEASLTSGLLLSMWIYVFWCYCTWFLDFCFRTARFFVD